MAARVARFLAVIRVIVAPGPVFALLGRRQFAKIAIRPARFGDPLPVINHFVIVKGVIIVVLRIVNADRGVFGAARQQHGRKQRNTQQDRAKTSRSKSQHYDSPLSGRARLIANHAALR